MTGGDGEVAATGAVSETGVVVPEADDSACSVDVAAVLLDVPPAEETVESAEDADVLPELSDGAEAAFVVLGCAAGESETAVEVTGVEAAVVLDCVAGESETAGEVTGAEAVAVPGCAASASTIAGEAATGVGVDATGATALTSGTISIRSWRGAATTGGSAICTLAVELITDVTARFCSSTWVLGVTVKTPLTYVTV